MERLNYNHLFYFYVTAKEGSIKSASEKIHVTQPTISDQLKLLEDHFECKLFDRRNRALYLTKEGELALKFAEKIFDLGTELTTRLRKRIRLPKKTIDIGITQFMSQYFLYDRILPLFDQTEFTVRIHEKERHYLIADLEEDNIDIVFSDSREGLSSAIDAHKMGINRTFAVAHKNLRKRNFIFPDGLNDIPFFNYTSDSYLKYEIELFFRKHNIFPRIVGEGDDIDLFLLVTEKEKAFTIVPEIAMSRFMLSKNIVTLGEIEDLQTTVWGLIRNDNKGLAYDLLGRGGEK